MGVVVRTRRGGLTAAPPRGTQRRHGPGGPAGTLIELQRAAGNRAVGQLVAHAPTALVPVVQRQPPPGEYGLDAPASESAYAKTAVDLWRTQKELDLDDFAEKLLTHVVADLTRAGVPPVTWTWATLGGAGIFDSEHWVIKVDVKRFSAKSTAEKVKHLKPAEVTEVVGTLYHEARHADQDVLIIRQLLDSKVSAADIKKQTKIRADVVDAVARTTFTDPLDVEEVAHARRMFAVMYGAHNQLLAFLIVNTPAFAGMGELAKARSDLAAATPHVAKVTAWQSAVLQPKVDAMGKAKGLTAVEQGLLTDLENLNTAVLGLAAAWRAVPDKAKPPKKAAATVRNAAAAVEQAMGTAYANLEGEQDAFRVEAEVKQAFTAANKAWKPPPKPGAKGTARPPRK
jgi:hypothetical protein